MTETRTSHWVLRTLLVAVPCGVLSCLVTLWVAGPSSSTPVPPWSELANDQILERLDEIERRMHTTLRSVEQVLDAPEAERQRIVEPMANMDHVQRQLDRIERLLAESRYAGGLAPVPIPRNTPINWQDLAALADLDRRDRPAAARATAMLTPAEVAARFGFPSESGGANGGGINWAYNRPRPNGERDDEVMFVFKGGEPLTEVKQGYVTSIQWRAF